MAVSKKDEELYKRLDDLGINWRTETQSSGTSVERRRQVEYPDYEYRNKYLAMDDRQQTITLEQLKKDYDRLTSLGDTAGAEKKKAEINWLYQKGGDAARAMGRRDTYEQNKKKLEELKQERSAGGYPKDFKFSDYSNANSAYAAYTAKSAQRKKELDKEISDLEAEIRKYEYGEKTADDYLSYTTRSDFDSVSANRDYRNPSRSDLQKYDQMSDSSTWRYDADGNLYDLFGNKLDSGNVDSDGNIINPYAQQYQVQDRLGLFLKASDAEKQEASGAVNGTEGTWESVIKDGIDGSWDQLREKEIQTYYYILNSSGQETADKYLDDMKTELNRRSVKEYNEDMTNSWDDASALEKLALSIASSPASVIGGIASGIEDAANLISGNPVNPYSAAHSYNNFASTVRSNQAEELNQKTNGISIPVIDYNAGDIYQALMSGMDSLVGFYMLGGRGYELSMGGQVFSGGAQTAQESGASRAQTIALAAAYAAAEIASEHVSIENLISMKSPETLGQLFKNVLKQGGIEASEEAASEIADILANSVILAEQSDLSKELEENGGDLKSAIFGKVKDILRSATGGFISGSALGGANSSIGYVGNQIEYSSNGRAIQNTEGGVEALRQLAIDTASGATEKTQGQINRLSEAVKEDNVSAKKVGRLYRQVENAVSEADQADMRKSLESKGFSTKEASQIVSAISDSYNGYELTSQQKRTMNRFGDDARVKETVSEIISGSNADVTKRNRMISAYTYGVNSGAKFSTETDQETAQKKESAEPVKQAAQNKYDVSEDGGTIVDGREDSVTIKRVASNDGGNLVLELDDGSTVSADKVSFATQDEAFVYSAIADLGLNADGANLILDSYNMEKGSISGEMFANGVRDAYRYGSYHYPISELEKGVFTSELTENQRKLAYNLGKTFGAQKTEAAETRVQAKVKAGAKNMADTERSSVSGKVHYDGDTSGLTQRQKTSISALETVADALGIQIYLFESKMDESGKRVGENGWYDPQDNSIHIDIYAGVQGNDTMLFTAAHELTHQIKEWSPAKFQVLADFLMEEYGKREISVEELVQSQIAKAKRNGREISYDTAYEEVIADSMETMLADGRVAEKLAKLKQQDRTLWQKMKDIISDLVAKIREAYAGLEPDSREGRHVAEMKDAIEHIQDLFVEGLVSASENYQASLVPGEESIVYAENGDPVAHATEDGSVQLSMRTYEEEGRSAFRAYLEKCVSSNKLTKAEMQEMLDGIEDIYQTCKQFKDKYAPFGTWSEAAVVRDTYGKPVFSVVTPNGEYKMNLDFSLVCKKRRSLDAVFNEMSRRGIIDDFELGQKSVVKINEIIRKHGFETACALCFVDAKRFRQASVADSFVNLYNELVNSLVPESKRGSIGYFNFAGNSSVNEVSSGIDTWPDSDLDFTHINEVLAQYENGTVEYKAAKYIKSNADSRRLLQRGDIMSSRGFDEVKSQNKDILKLYNSKKGTGGPKAAFGDVQYMNEIIQKARFWTPAKAYAVGGVRIQSFSDYVPRMVFDYVQMVYDLAATKLPAHAYTKEALFVKQFGLTGVKINMSLIPAIADGGIAPGLDANGDYVWAGESFDFETAKEIQNAEGYTENCGTICVGVSYQHIVKLLGDSDIRMVIPYHKSGLNDIVAHMNRIEAFTDYTSTKTNPGGCQNTVDKNGKKVERDFDFNKVLRSVGDPKAAAKAYLDWCSSHGYQPKFAEFAWHENYYKLLVDFTVYDNDGNYVPQREVRAVFPTEGSAFGSMKSLIESGLQEDAVIEGKRDKSLSSIVDEIERTLPKTEAEIAETEVVQADRDLESELSDAGIKYSSRVTDDDTLSFLDGQETITTYKTMQIVDGKLYPPMASRIEGKYEDYSELGVWEQATEHPELIKGNGKFKLDKGKGQGSLEAAYNPYMHSSNLVINDQFSGAYKRTNLVTVECVVPVSEATSGYHAQYAKDSVGWHPWHTGTVAGSIRKAKGVQRQVFLSRWIKPVRIVPDSEVASMYKDLLSGTDVAVPDNVVTKSLLEELKKAGVKIEESGRLKVSTDSGVKYSYRGVNADGIEVYETSEEVKRLSYKERQKRFLEIMTNEYRGKTARFVRNGHTYFAAFDEKDVNKNIYGDNKSDTKGWKAKINVGADGDIFELVENARYNGSRPETGKKIAAHRGVGYWDYFVKTVQIDNTVFDLLANVRKKADGAFVYSIQLVENKKKKASPPLGSLLRASSGVTNASDVTVPQPDSGVKLSDRDYSYEALTSKPDMPVTLLHDNVPKNRADVVAQAKKNAAKVGKFNPKDGSVSVRVNDIDTDVILGTPGLKHSLDRRLGVNAPVVVNAGEIIQNSIRVNEMTAQKPEASESYVLIGAARNSSRELYVVRSVVNRFSNELASMDVLYAINAKKEPAALLPRVYGDKSAPSTDSTISISELLDYVNRYFPEVLPEDVLKHYGHDRRPDGKLGESALFSDRTDDSLSNRALLADAFENLAMNPAESEAIQKYKQVVDKLDAEQARLTNLRKQIKDLSFAKGPKDTKAIKALQFEANQVANRINTYDRQLLRLTAAKPLQDVLQREKKLAYKRAEQKGKDAMAAYRKKVSQKNLELLNKYQESRKKAVDSRNRTALRHKIRGVVDELNSYLLHGTKDRHILIGLQKSVAESLEAINMDTVGAAERIAKLQQDLMKAKTPEKIQEISKKISHIQEMGENSARRLSDLKAAYDSFVDSDDPMVANAYDEVISLKLEAVIKEVGNTPLRNMTVSQLESVYDMYKMVLTRVRDSNKAFKQGKNQDIAILGNRVMEEVEKAGGKKKKQISAMRGVSTFAWNNLKPIYAFERIGSETLTGVFNSVRSGEDTWATDVTDARAFYLDEVKKYGYNGWDFDKKYSFQSSSGMEFELNLEQIMSLYAYSKRKQAGDHLKYGGFVFDPKTEVYEKTKSGLKVKVNLTEATAYNLSAETLGDIIGTLTEDQKGFVDEMQDYLSSTMGEKGNEVSLEMYGVKLFKEQNYFPLKSATQFMAKAKEQAQGEVKIKNSGFSKETTPKARNPIVLSSFMDVWANHVNEMSMYHAFVLPMEDFYRVYNYKTPTAENMATESVEMYIQNAYGTGATQYIEQLLKDLNGGARTDNTTGFANKFMGKFKKGAVFASASVVIQQPSAIARATALIDTKYFIGPKLDSKHHKATWEEVKKYAPVAIIKEMGYFDTNMGKSTKDFITAREYSGFSEKAKAMVTDSGYRDEILSKAPALADEIAWCGIWNAVKRETAAKHKGMNTKSEEFLKLAGERFTEVITKTQVYDSVLSRSAMMRSKDTVVKMATAFMAEPTTSINMIYDALVKGKNGNIKYARNAIGAVIASNILNAILVSFVYAGRDDDDDETYLEKYTGTLVGEVIDSFNPLTYIPFIKDIVSIVQGYDVERSDMAVFSDLRNAYQALGKENVSGWKKVENFAGSIAQLFGLPVKNIMRDARTAYNIFQSAMSGQKTTKAGMKYSVLEAVTGNSVSNQNQLYNAYLEGDTAMISRVESRYKDEKAVNSAIRTALVENDQRITKAAQAKIDGDLDEYMRLAKEIIGDGRFSQDNVVSAINSVINAMTKDDSDSSGGKASGLFKIADFTEAIAQGDSAMANAIKSDIIQTAQKNGKTEEEAEKSFCNSAASSIKELFLTGDISESKAVDALATYCGRTADEANADVQYWAFKQKYPDIYVDDSWFDAYYEKIADSGISIDTYMSYRDQVSDITGDGKKERRMDIINSLPITNAQKDALYFAEGWAESKIGEAPWH